jgi:Ribonuclease G/E
MTAHPCPNCRGTGVVRPHRKLTDQQVAEMCRDLVAEMRRDLDAGEALASVAARYGVAPSTAEAIRDGFLRKARA